MSPDVQRYLAVLAAAALLLVLFALARRAAATVIDDAPYVITDPERHAACVARHPSQARTYCGACGQEDCTCGTGLGDVVEAWLAGQNDRPYNWAEDEGSGLR